MTTALILATRLEAEPFIKQLHLTPAPHTPWPTFTAGDLTLVLSGIGKAHAAACTAWTITTLHPENILNAGAAGATNTHCPLSSCWMINQVTEPDHPDLTTGQPHTHTPLTLPDLPATTLATQDHPVVTPDERTDLSSLADLVDMEGAAVLQTATFLHTPCRLAKFVSDTPDDHAIRDNIARLRTPFATWTIKNVLGRLTAEE